MEYTVESGIEVPKQTTATKYPFAKMDVGDSFSFDAKLAVKIRSAAMAWGKVNGKRFSVRRVVGSECRCWRIK